MDIPVSDYNLWLKDQAPDLALDTSPFLNEAAFLEALSYKVAYMMHYNIGVLFQYFYKIDILEPQLKVALAAQDVPMAFAKLILEKHIASKALRLKYPPHKPDKDDELAW